MRRQRDVREFRERLLNQRKKGATNKSASKPILKQLNTARRTDPPKPPRARKAQTTSVTPFTPVGPSLDALPAQPKISVLTATYNCAKYLSEAIRSVQKQSYTQWEMLICDDLSDDESYSLAMSFSEADQRIKVFRNESKLFCSSTYNRLLHLATGDICAILDGDDAIAKDAMEWIVRAYQTYPNLGYIYTQFWWCDAKLKSQKKGHSNIPKHKSLLECESKGHHYYSHWRTFRTQLRNLNNLFDPGLKSAVDKHLGYILEETCEGGFFNLPLYLYRRHNNSISTRGKGKDNRWAVINAAQRRRKDKNITPFPIRLVVLR